MIDFKSKIGAVNDALQKAKSGGLTLKAGNMGGLTQGDAPPLDYDPLVGHLSDEQRDVIRAIESGGNVFLTGKAGTGKSTLTAALVARHCRAKGLYVCGSTGISAYNLADRLARDLPDGVEAPKCTTLHRWAGIGLGPQEGMEFEEFYDEWFHHNRMTRAKMGALQRARYARCLILDEVSMVPGRLLDYLDWHLRHVRGVADAPFGGVQLVCVGDFLQLPPVAKDQRYDWAFASGAWQSAGMRGCVLRTIHRQADPEFANLLNACREGVIDARAAAILERRIARFPARDIIRMMTHNAQVDKWNEFQLSQIADNEHIYWMGFNQYTRDYDEQALTNNILAPRCLKLKRGARVMVVANITDACGDLLACNGTMARVTGLDEDAVDIKTDDGVELVVRKQLWTLNPLQDDSPGAFQIPLRLAYAMTIHKSQGLSLDSAIVDARAAREPGQTYVALSRLRTLEGLWLKDAIKGVVTSQKALEFMRGIER